MSTTLAARQSRRTIAWNLARGILAVALLIHLFFAAASITVREERERVDAVTGSQERETIWMFGWTAGPQIEKSPLERRLLEADIPWRPEWRFTHGTHRALLGNATCYSRGSVPPIYWLSNCQEPFVEASTDDEIRQFIHTMQSGSEQERHVAVAKANEKATRFSKASQGKG